MNPTLITIDNGRVSVNSASGDIWMTQHEIAELFGVFVSAGGANIRFIFKNEVLDERLAWSDTAMATRPRSTIWR